VAFVAASSQGALQGGGLGDSPAIVPGLVLLSAVGLIDDIRDLPRFPRYAVHVGVASLAVFTLRVPGAAEGKLIWLFAPLLVVGLTYLINAVNFMDGIDMLVAGTGVVILAFLSWFTEDPTWLLVAAAYAGFVPFNLPPARLFMGDAGSTTLGALIGVAILSGASRLRWEHSLVLAPLVGDSTYTLLRRLLRGEDIFSAHHSHIYQRLLRSGLSHGKISASYIAATFAAGLSVVTAGSLGAAASGAACLALLLSIELYLKRRKVPFTRPAAALRVTAGSVDST
jgi:UDP-N-acetylmuramyl pentapeptide phosphotransferase/UDP-N-acetylglucosamine-1-phosphate transferase